MFIENIKLAFAAMRGNKLRTLLSLLGIIIGVGSVVAILTLGQSATESITDSITSGGLNMVSIFPVANQKTSSVFTEDFGDTLMRNVDGIDSVLPQVSSNAYVRKGSKRKSVTVNGVLSSYAGVQNYEPEEGEFFSSMDNINRRQVIVLGAEVAKELFPYGDAVGQYVSLFRNQAKSYLVVGVMKKKDASFSNSYDAGVYIPYNTYQQRFRRTSTVGAYVVEVNEDVNTIEVSDKITQYLDNLVGADAYGLFSPATLVEMSKQITGTFSSFLAAIAAISLLVGGIGIMNIMLVSVAERTKEIGIRKALGASPSTIRGQFLTEAITLTLIGGILGIVFGAGISVALTNLVNWSLHLSYFSFVFAMGFSMCVGVFFGWYPAMKASRLDPIEALNYE
ncbi:MAG: ABC transporter permease [Sphaerochaetaceae bacterium]|nr:ABC transporter permease [Sphaerochaetaceae bacterium]